MLRTGPLVHGDSPIRRLMRFFPAWRSRYFKLLISFLFRYCRYNETNWKTDDDVIKGGKHGENVHHVPAELVNNTTAQETRSRRKNDTLSSTASKENESWRHDRNLSYRKSPEHDNIVWTTRIMIYFVVGFARQHCSVARTTTTEKNFFIILWIFSPTDPTNIPLTHIHLLFLSRNNSYS